MSEGALLGCAKKLGRSGEGVSEKGEVDWRKGIHLTASLCSLFPVSLPSRKFLERPATHAMCCYKGRGWSVMLDFLELQNEEGGKRGFLSFAIGPLLKYILKKQLKKRLLYNKVFLFF